MASSIGTKTSLNVKTLFNLVKMVSENYKRNKKDFDGQEFWHPIKAILSKTSWQASNWVPISDEDDDNTMKLCEFCVDDHGNRIILEINHFQIQLVRIPRRENPSLRKVIQIALNLGQYYGSITTTPRIINSVLHTANKKTIDDFISTYDQQQKLTTMLEQNDINNLFILLSNAY